MPSLYQMLGSLINTLVGPRTTIIEPGRAKNSVVSLEPENLGERVEVKVVSREIVYVTTFKRGWPTRRRRLYQVTATVPPEYMRGVGPKFLETVTFPRLCNFLLRWTHYPHQYAINAFLIRALEGKKREFKVQL